MSKGLRESARKEAPLCPPFRSQLGVRQVVSWAHEAPNRPCPLSNLRLVHDRRRQLRSSAAQPAQFCPCPARPPAILPPLFAIHSFTVIVTR